MKDKSVISFGKGISMQGCTYEQADTRVVAHVTGTARRGYSRMSVRTADMDILVIYDFTLTCTLAHIQQFICWFKAY